MIDNGIISQLLIVTLMKNIQNTTKCIHCPSFFFFFTIIIVNRIIICYLRKTNVIIPLKFFHQQNIPLKWELLLYNMIYFLFNLLLLIFNCKKNHIIIIYLHELIEKMLNQLNFHHLFINQLFFLFFFK